MPVGRAGRSDRYLPFFGLGFLAAAGGWVGFWAGLGAGFLVGFFAIVFISLSGGLECPVGWPGATLPYHDITSQSRWHKALVGDRSRSKV